MQEIYLSDYKLSSMERFVIWVDNYLFNLIYLNFKKYMLKINLKLSSLCLDNFYFF